MSACRPFADSFSPRPLGRIAGTVACLAALGITAFATPPSFADAPARVVNFQAIRTGLKPADWPLLGSPDAPAVLLELFDYTCASCQQMSHRVRAARQQYGSNLSVIVLPVSLQGRHHARSQQLARWAMAVFVTEPERFADFHEWLLVGRSVDEARRHASELVGAERLQSAASSDQVQKYLRIIEQIYQKANRGTLPLLTSDRFTSRGLMQTNQQMFETIEQYHGQQLDSGTTGTMGG